MALYERARGDSGFIKLDIHGFAAGLRELARGAVTKPQVVSAFSLDAGDESELDAIIATYNALGTDLEKAEFIVKFEDVLILSEKNHYTKAKAQSELGF